MKMLSSNEIVKEDIENSDQKETLNMQTWFSIEDDSAVNTKKQQDLERRLNKKNKKRVTTAEIEARLKEAELRRNNRYEKRVQRTVESRQKVSALSIKLDKLAMHDRALQNGKCEDSENVLSKKEFVRLATEVSLEFESLSERYTSDLARANEFMDIIDKSSTEDQQK